MADLNAQAIRDLAEAHLAAVLQRLPSDRMGRFVMFIEVVRAMDYWGISAYPDSLEKVKVSQSIDLMYWGWNRAVAELFEPLDQPGAFPLMKSTPDSRGFAAGLLQEFGKASLARRLADMCERGILEVVRDARSCRGSCTSECGRNSASAAVRRRIQEWLAQGPFMRGRMAGNVSDAGAAHRRRMSECMKSP